MNNKEDLIKKANREIRNLSSRYDYNIKFELIGGVSISSENKLNAYLSKKTRLFKRVKVDTYVTWNTELSKFLWKMVDAFNPEVDISVKRKDCIEVKGIIGSTSKIVGKLPDGIYETVKDKRIEIQLDFITNPYDLTVSIYELSSTSLEYEMSKILNSNSKKELENFKRYQEDYEKRRLEYIRQFISIVDTYSKR